MTIKSTVTSTIQKLESLCESYEKNPLLKLERIEETVVHLSREVQALDLASDQTLKCELNILQSMLLKLTSVLKEQQQNLEQQVQSIHLHQRALQAYSCVANNNGGSFA